MNSLESAFVWYKTLPIKQEQMQIKNFFQYFHPDYQTAGVHTTRPYLPSYARSIGRMTAIYRMHSSAQNVIFP